MVSRVIIVTGAGTGLGRAIAQVLADRGHACVLVGRRREMLEETAALAGGDTLLVQADVTDAGDRERIVQTTLDRYGRIEVLVNNAGVSSQHPLFADQEEEWRRVMAANVDACFFLAQQVIPAMRDGGYGRIINITSVYATLSLNPALYSGMFPSDDKGLGPRRQPAYHASKGALLTLTRELAGAVGPWGITANAISPGAFMTEQSEAIVDDEVVASFTERVPLKRWGEPAEIGYAVAFLASEEAGFITGVELRVDGGWTIW